MVVSTAEGAQRTNSSLVHGSSEIGDAAKPGQVRVGAAEAAKIDHKVIGLDV
jgi:hypothetical protein